MAEYLRKGCGDLNEVALGNDDVKDDDHHHHHHDTNSQDIEVVEIGTGETLAMLDRNCLVAMKFKLDKIRVLNKKQSHISDHFMLESNLYDRFC